MSRNTGNTAGGIFSTEYSNKIILLLLGVLALFVFMDFQARRNSAPEAAPRSSAALHPVLEPIRDKAETVLGTSEGAASGAVTPLHSLTGGADSSETGAGVYRNEPVFRPVEPENADPDSFALYFLRFKGSRLKDSRTEMVRVRRPLPDGEVTLMDIIAQLQSGPLSGERGLLNAFGDRIKVSDAYVDRGVAYVYVDKSIDRLGAHIVQDRIDQLVFTLTQFPEIQGVQLIKDGSPIESLGGGKIPVSGLLRPGSRAVTDYP